MSTYSERLKLALESTDKSKADLAKGLGVSYQAISQVVSGTTKSLTAENSAAAARELGVSSYWLATGLGNMKHNGEELLPLSLLEARAVAIMRSLPEVEMRLAVQDIECRASDHAQRLSRLLAK